MVMVIVGILSAIAVPKLRVAHQRAVAAHVIADFTTIRLAAFQYYATETKMPPTAPQQVAPPELEDFLPGGFNFDFEDGVVLYRWRSWPTTLPGTNDAVAGVEFESSDERLISLIKELYQGEVAFGTNTRVTLLF